MKYLILALILLYILITLGFSYKAYECCDKLSNANPKETYKNLYNETKLNHLGCIFCFVLYIMIIPEYLLCSWSCQFIYFIFHVGRNDKFEMKRKRKKLLKELWKGKYKVHVQSKEELKEFTDKVNHIDYDAWTGLCFYNKCVDFNEYKENTCCYFIKGIRPLSSCHIDDCTDTDNIIEYSKIRDVLLLK